MTKPNLFIVGNPKSGTSALHYFLGQHPDIFMSIPKEPKYFCKDFHMESDAFHKTKAFFSKYRKEQDYLQIFSGARKERILGEASPNYLYSNVAAKEIYSFNPDAKIIIMLRNPVDFIYSLHTQHRLRNYEDVENFESALLLEKERRQGKSLPLTVDHPSALYYSEMIKYSEQIHRYYGLFDKSNIKIIIYEDFKLNNRDVYRDTLTFLGIDHDFVPDFTMVNISKKPRNKRLNNLVQSSYIISAMNVTLPPKCWSIVKRIGERLVWKEEMRPAMDSSLREKLMKQYNNEVVKISDLLGIDLQKRWYGDFENH